MILFWLLLLALYGALCWGFNWGLVKLVLIPITSAIAQQLTQFWQVMGFLLIIEISLIIIISWIDSYKNKGG